MTTLRMCSCLFLFGMLLILGGCKKAEETAHDVTITNCKVSEETVNVHEGGRVRWEPTDNHDYTIRFSDPSEPTPNPFPAKHGASNPPRTMRGRNGCVKNPQHGVDCKYSLTRDNEGAPCADPIIHIEP